MGIRLRTIIISGIAITATACTPTVVTDRNNNIVDVRNGTRWDVVGIDQSECDHIGGSYNTATATCEDIDY